MAFIKIWIHLIWATKNREKIINKEIKYKLLDHIKNNATNKSIYIDFLNCTSDHIHLLVSLPATKSIAQVVHLIKGESSYWVNKTGLIKKKFEWQDEYIAISVGESVVDKVREYIKNQEEHHSKKSFAEEYKEFLIKYGFNNLVKTVIG